MGCHSSRPQFVPRIIIFTLTHFITHRPAVKIFAAIIHRRLIFFPPCLGASLSFVGKTKKKYSNKGKQSTWPEVLSVVQSNRHAYGDSRCLQWLSSFPFSYYTVSVPVRSQPTGVKPKMGGRELWSDVKNWQAALLTLRRLMSYIYGAPILDVSRSHTTTQHSR
jgi:hypothetical protein